MLILKRWQDEKVILTLTAPLAAGAKIEVIPIELAASSVRLGFVAPRSVSIMRQEVIDEQMALKEAQS